MQPSPALILLPAPALAPILVRAPARLSLLFALCLASAGVMAEEPAPLADPARSEALRHEAGALREAAEARFDGENIACYKRFLVNGCIDQARARRLVEIRKARELDTQADRLDLVEKNRRYDAHQIEREAEAAKKSIERAKEEAQARADNEARMQRYAHDEAQRTQRAEEGKAGAVKALDARAQHDAAEAKRRADEARDAALRADKARQDRADYADRAREHTEKMAEKAAKKKSGAPAGDALLPGKP